MKGKIRKINELLVNKEISATELLNKYIDYTEKYNPTLNAYINTTYDEAFKYAQKADDIIAKKCRIPLLCGIPMSVKDCISTKDIYTTCGSKMLCNYKSIYDAFVIEKMKDNFAVMLGKTNMDEFAMGSTSETSFFGPTKNPYDIKCVPGGSSGGAAASVGADLAVSVTGIAGPNADGSNKPVGLVYIAVASESQTVVSENHFSGDREAVREQTIVKALQMVLQMI